jgi:hypothetical protein
MDSFEKVFGSTFKDDNRTLTNTLNGFTDHSVRFDANLPTTGPFLSELKAANIDTKGLSLQAKQALQQLGLMLGTQKEATLQTEAAQAKAFDRIRKNEATLCGDMFIEDETERKRLYNLLYPTDSLQYYTAAKLDTEMADRFGQYLARTELEAEALGQRFVELVQSDLGPFRDVRDTQVAALSKTSDAQGTIRKLVEKLNEQCDYNKNLLSAHYRTDLSRVANCWKSIFYLRATTRAVTGQVLNLGVKAHQHRQLFDLEGFAQFKALTIILRDGGPLYIGRGDKATAPMSPLAVPVPTEPTPFVVDLAGVPGTGTHLIIYNETGKVAHLDAQLS